MQFTRDFIDMLGEQESPIPYLRWSIISAVGAAIARRAYISFGPDKIYPNQYIILMGTPGSRKGTGPRVVKQLLREAGYDNFAPSKSRKEAMWDRMAHIGKRGQEAAAMSNVDEIDIDALLGTSSVAAAEASTVADMYIVAQEWIDFIGQDEELINNLTDLWDNLDVWDYHRTTKASIYIHQPTLSMLGGATPSSFTKVIPPSALGGGFMRRLLLIYATQTKRVFWPDAIDQKIFDQLVAMFARILVMKERQVSVSEAAMQTLQQIYMRDHFLDDSRFDHYVGVRYTHLLKLCLISAIARDSHEISATDVVYSNTLLSRAEVAMPSALGHFGMARNASTANAVLDVIKRAKRPMDLTTLYCTVGADVGGKEELRKLLDLLVDTRKIKRMKNRTTGAPFYLAQVTITERLITDPHFDQSLLYEEEKI